MKKSEVIQTRVEKDVKRKLEAKADERDQTMAELLRELAENATETGDDESENSLKRDFLSDVHELVMGRDGREGVFDVIESCWDEFTVEEGLAELRDVVLDETRQVFVVGQGSSLSVSRWLAARLRENDVPARATPAEEVPTNLLDDAVLFLISHSGETESIVELAEQTYGRRDVDTVGFTDEDSTLAERVGYRIRVPDVDENVSPYATKSVPLQMTVLQLVLFDSDPSLEAYRERFDHLDEFVREHLKIRTTADGDSEAVGLDEASPFSKLVRALHERDEQDKDVVVSSLGRFAPVGSEAVQKCSEFLHVNATYEDLGSIRDRLVNILYRGDAYLFVLFPYRYTADDAEADDAGDRRGFGDSPDYEACRNYLFRNRDSVDNLLKFNDEPAPLRLLGLTFNELDSQVEAAAADHSYYGSDGVVGLESRDGMTDDLEMLVATYLFVYGVLDVLWEYDEEVRQEVVKRLWDDDSSVRI